MTRAKSAATMTTAQLGAKRLRTGRTRLEVMTDLCKLLSNGSSLKDACAAVTDAPVQSHILEWIEDDPHGVGEMYTRARYIGYQLLADQIQKTSAETHCMTTVHAQDTKGNFMFNKDGTPQLKEVLAPLSSDVIASKRLQVETMKWMLSKMLPKVFGDKTTTELTGAGGGPIQLAAVNLKGLNDEELHQMQELMAKAAARLPP